MGRFTMEEWRAHHVSLNVDRHVRALDIAQAIRELEQQELNAQKWRAYWKHRKAQRAAAAAAEMERQRKRSLAQLRAERLEDDQRRKRVGR
jgi:hypothetical protein